jgi:hypothetical protein
MAFRSSSAHRFLAALLVVSGSNGCRGDADVVADDDIGDASTSSSGSSDGGTHSESGSESDDGEPAGCPSGPGPAGIGSIAVEPGTLVDDPFMSFPGELAEVGIYPHAPDLSVVPEGALLYEPAWPLWSNGSDKHRYLILPAGTSIDTTDPAAWTFPPGALLFKTFLYDDGVQGCPRPVETRVMRKTLEGGWDYAVYGWDLAGEQAERLDIAEPNPIPVMGEQGAFEHHVPARIECRACHESARGEALGVERLQLSASLGDAATMQLEDLEEHGAFEQSVEAEMIVHADEDTRNVLGMFHGNCVHCHNGSGGPSSSFDLRHDVALANTIGQETESSASAAGIRIVPGSPEQSILFQAFSGETDDPEVKSMPPMGVDVRDAASIELLRRFISDLEE